MLSDTTVQCAVWITSQPAIDTISISADYFSHYDCYRIDLNIDVNT